MRSIKLALLALVAVLAVGAAAAGSATAFHPLFFNLAKNSKLSFTGTGGEGILRGLNLGVLGTIHCEKNSTKGESGNLTTLAHKIVAEFTGKCLQTINGTSTECNEPIVTKEMFGELGLASSTNHKVLLLLAPESGTEFVKVTCGSNVTTTEGAIVGEYPENNSLGQKQINTERTNFELVFTSENANENQKITSIELLGVSMTKAELKVSGFFGGKASEEATGETTLDGLGEISTTKQ